jgi:1D-myo-inositol 3-kinase
MYREGGLCTYFSIAMSPPERAAPIREFLLVGHYCHDTIVAKDGSVRLELGGASAHASAVLLPLGVDFHVVAKVGADFRYAGRAPRPPRVVSGQRTTSFVDDYRGPERAGTMIAAAPPIDPGDLGDAPCRIGMALGIADEIGAGTLARLRELAEIAVGDAQAFVRHVDAQGRVALGPPGPPLLSQIDRLDWLKLSRSEASALDPSSLGCAAIVTDGARGSVLWQDGREIHVPSFEALEVDPTGAGDCFLAGFAVGLWRGWEPARAALFGNFCGALAVAQHGVPRLTAESLAAFDRAAKDRMP